MKLAIVHKEKCKSTVCGREIEVAEVVGSSLLGRVHFLEEFTSWKDSAQLEAWRILGVML